MNPINAEAKLKVVVGAAVMGLATMFYYLGKNDLSQTIGYVGSFLLLGLGVNSAGLHIGKGLGGLSGLVNQILAPANDTSGQETIPAPPAPPTPKPGG